MKTKIAILAALLATGIVAPAFANSSNDDQTTAAKLDEVAFRASTFNAATMAPRLVDWSDNPDRTGGGSSGYNDQVHHDYI